MTRNKLNRPNTPCLVYTWQLHKYTSLIENQSEAPRRISKKNRPTAWGGGRRIPRAPGVAAFGSIVVVVPPCVSLHPQRQGYRRPSTCPGARRRKYESSQRTDRAATSRRPTMSAGRPVGGHGRHSTAVISFRRAPSTVPPPPRGSRRLPGASSLDEAAPTERDSVRAPVSEQMLNKRDSVPLLFGCLDLDREFGTKS